MKKFLYVFKKDDRDRLEDAGFTLMYSDESNGVYIFKADRKIQFDLSDTQFLLSDTMMY